MKQSAFIAALKFVAHAKAKNDVRYYLNTVQFEFHYGTLTLIATDGHRMAWATVEAPDMPDGKWLIDGAGVDAVLKAFKPNSTGSIAFDFQADRLMVESGAGVAAARYVDGKAFSPLLGNYGRTILEVGPVNSCLRLSAANVAVAGVMTAQCIIMPMRPE